jgi:histidinol-phosphatase
MSFSSLGGWGKVGLEKQFLDLNRSVWRTRGFGDFWSYMLVAEGAVDIATEPDVLLHDLAAPAIIVTESGGRFTDLSGADGPAGGSAVATNALLHDEVLERLRPS